MLNSLFACCDCTSFQALSTDEMEALDKTLGNIKKAHKSLTFTGLIISQHKKAMMLHYLTSPTFLQRQNDFSTEVNPQKNLKEEAARLADMTANPPTQTEIKKKVTQVLERAISFRLAQQKMCKELGFDHSRETFIKGETSIVVILELTPEYSLLFFFEMNQLKVEFFDCDQFVTTIDDLVVSLLEVLVKEDIK